MKFHVKNGKIKPGDVINIGNDRRVEIVSRRGTAFAVRVFAPSGDRISFDDIEPDEPQEHVAIAK